MIVNKGNKRYKHLTQDDRNTLEIMLQNAATFQTIAAALGKDACTISREVRKHRTLVANRFTNYDEQNNVINESCPKLEKPPYVCNACKKRHSCRLKRYLYVSRKAQKKRNHTHEHAIDFDPCLRFMLSFIPFLMVFLHHLTVPL